MPVPLTYPGVYIEEIPSGVRTITGVATSITAFIGYTPRGDLNKAVRIQSFGDFERQFGGLERDSLVSYAIKEFFLNGGSDAYVVRVSKGGRTAEVTMKDHSDNNVLNAIATNLGTWGNNLGLDVDYDTRTPESTFNLTVTRYEIRDEKFTPAETERHINLSMNSASPMYAVNVVNVASKLIKLERSPITFEERGWSRSGDLSSFPSGLEGVDTISGILNGSKPFTIRLRSTPSDMTTLINALKDAIKATGLEDQISVYRTDVFGTEEADGNFVKLESQTADERSSVEILNAPSKDASPKLYLGLANGGRERDGSSYRRPMPTGTISGDLSDVLISKDPISGNITLSITDKGSSESILDNTVISIIDLMPGLDLPKKLQEKIREINNPATKGATVQLSGPILRVVTSAGTPNACINLGEEDTTIDLRFGDSAYKNVQQYRLGIGAEFGAQTGAIIGLDGGLPSAIEIQGIPDSKTGLYALLDVDLFNILSIPETSRLDSNSAREVISEATAFCEQRRAFFIIDPDPNKNSADIVKWAEDASKSRNAAVYFPQIQISDPLNGYRLRDLPPSGAMAGIFARTDSQRGIWKAPAGTEAVVNGAQALSTNITDMENGPLNQKGVNCIRSFPVYGIVAWGARTRRGADEQADEYKYIPIRRLALYIEESLYRGLKWVVFEPNDEPLWSQIRLNVGAFMQNLFRLGAFQGKMPQEAYFVKCDKETTIQNDINLGVVNIVVGFAPLKPAEFVVIKIQQMAGQIQV